MSTDEEKRKLELDRSLHRLIQKQPYEVVAAHLASCETQMSKANFHKYVNLQLSGFAAEGPVSPLVIAVHANSFKVAELLCKYGADVLSPMQNVCSSSCTLSEFT